MISFADLTVEANLISAIIGLLTGVVSSLTTWWLLTRFVRPKLEWRSTIAKYRYDDDAPGQYRYSVALHNASRFRDAMDIRVVIRIRIPGLIRAGAAELFTIEEAATPRLRSKKTTLWRVRFDLIDDRTRRRYLNAFPDALRDKWESGEDIDLEEFMSAFPGTSIEVAGFCSDKYTWARSWCLESLKLRDVRIGRHAGEGHTGSLVDSHLGNTFAAPPTSAD